jgi:hypothetical protein
MKKSTEHFIKLEQCDISLIKFAVKELKQIENRKAMANAKPAIALLDLYVYIFEAGK